MWLYSYRCSEQNTVKQYSLTCIITTEIIFIPRKLHNFYAYTIYTLNSILRPQYFFHSKYYEEILNSVCSFVTDQMQPNLWFIYIFHEFSNHVIRHQGFAIIEQVLVTKTNKDIPNTKKFWNSCFVLMMYIQKHLHILSYIFLYCMLYSFPGLMLWSQSQWISSDNLRSSQQYLLLRQYGVWSHANNSMSLSVTQRRQKCRT